MPKIPYSGYNYPLGPKIERPLIPFGFIELEKAIELLGRTMFPDEWTGEERGFFGTGAFGRKFRSKIELETDQALQNAVLMAQCELECELYGGNPKERYHLRTTPQKNDEPFMPMGDLPMLSPKEKIEVEGRFAEEINLAKAVRERREKVEHKFLRELLWAGSLTAHYVAWDGRVLEIEQHTWGSPDGGQEFERGWIEVSGEDGETSVRPILISESAVMAALRPGSSAPTHDENDISFGVANTGPVGAGGKIQKPLPISIDDEDLLEEMENLLINDQGVQSIGAASLRVVDDAKGGGMPESKAKRLTRKYQKSGKFNPRLKG